MCTTCFNIQKLWFTACMCVFVLLGSQNKLWLFPKVALTSCSLSDAVLFAKYEMNFSV